MTVPDEPAIQSAPPIIQEIVEQHAEEAAFLWYLRDRATDQPHFTGLRLAQVDSRIEAHLDGLRAAGPFGLQTARAHFQERRTPSAMFPLAVLALDHNVESVLEDVLELAAQAPDAWRDLFGAVAWVSADNLRSRAVTWLEGCSPFRRLLGVVACSLHRADPRGRLDPLLEDEPLVRRRALRLIGEIGRIDLRERLLRALHGEDEDCRFWGAWSAVLLGERGAGIPLLQAFAVRDGPFRWRALDLVVRAMGREPAIAWLRELAQEPTHGRLVVVAAGVLGDPSVVPWLVDRMDRPALARVAGAAFSMITGADLSQNGLDGAPPEELGVGSTDEPSDENVEMDLDEHLSWPDAKKVRVWWEGEQHRFRVGVRHLRGVPLTRESCELALGDGGQNERRAAAFELALLRADARLANWRAGSRVDLE